MIKEFFEAPEAEIVVLPRVDMLVTSGDGGFGGNEDGVGGSGSGGSVETPVLPNLPNY